MNGKKIRSNIIFILIVVFLIITALMIRFEFNPISYIMGNNNNEIVSEDEYINYNGIYRYKETLQKSYKLFEGCTLNYYDFYIVVLNNNYYRYKVTCVGTFLLDSGETKSLKFSETLEKNIVIKYEKKDYFKTDLINTVVEGNYFKKNSKTNKTLYPNSYQVLMKEVQLPGKEFSILRAEIFTSKISYPFTFTYLENQQFQIEMLDTDKKVLYAYVVDDLDDLPLFLEFGPNLSIIEPVIVDGRYAFTFKAITDTGVTYDLNTKFPITVDGKVLTQNNNIYIKYSSAVKAFVMLVGDSDEFCEKNSSSTDVAYYVFHIKYDYEKKNFTNPEFIKKVYKNEGCKYVDDLMEA